MKDDLRLNSYPVQYLERLMKRNDPIKTREFYETIVQRKFSEKQVSILCNMIESYNNPSFASMLLEHQSLTISQTKRLVSKFGVSALDFMKMKLSRETDEFLKYFITLNDKELLSLIFHKILEKECIVNNIKDLLLFAEEHNLELRNESISACEKFISSKRFNDFDLKLKIVTKFQTDEMILKLVESLLEEEGDLVMLIQNVSLFTLEKIKQVIRNQKEHPDKIAKLVFSLSKLKLASDLAPLQESLIISIIEVLNECERAASFTTSLEWLQMFEIIKTYTFSKEYLSNLINTVRSNSPFWNYYYQKSSMVSIQTALIELSTLKGVNYIQEDETLLSILEAVQYNIEHSIFLKVEAIYKSIKTLEPPLKKLKQ